MSESRADVEKRLYKKLGVAVVKAEASKQYRLKRSGTDWTIPLGPGSADVIFWNALIDSELSRQPVSPQWRSSIERGNTRVRTLTTSQLARRTNLLDSAFDEMREIAQEELRANTGTIDSLNSGEVRSGNSLLQEELLDQVRRWIANQRPSLSSQYQSTLVRREMTDKAKTAETSPEHVPLAAPPATDRETRQRCTVCGKFEHDNPQDPDTAHIFEVGQPVSPQTAKCKRCNDTGLERDVVAEGGSWPCPDCFGEAVSEPVPTTQKPCFDWCPDCGTQHDLNNEDCPAPSESQPARCTLCGSPRIVKPDGTLGACTLVGCKDPLHDIKAEQPAREVDAHETEAIAMNKFIADELTSEIIGWVTVEGESARETIRNRIYLRITEAYNDGRWLRARDAREQEQEKVRG